MEQHDILLVTREQENTNIQTIECCHDIYFIHVILDLGKNSPT